MQWHNYENSSVLRANEIRPVFATEITNVDAWNPGVIYVDMSAPGSYTGMSWKNAYRDLQDAFTRARAGCGSQIWVAAGTYKPTNGSSRSISFEMIEGVDIYGGFPTGGGPRNPGIYQTILSGDIDDNGNLSNNSYHVVKCENVNNAILDGFIITGGNAGSNSEPNCYGGGIYIYNSSPTIKNCIFSNNSARTGGGMCNIDSSNPNITNCIFSGNTCTFGYGGGMLNRENSSPTIENCIFSDNSAGSGGGGMGNYLSEPNVTNCIFYGNQATYNSGFGGGIYNSDSSPTITNCTFSANSATNYGYGGGMYNFQPSPMVTNCIFWGNDASYNKEIYPPNQTVSYCDIEGGWPGGTNIDKNPCFVNPDANNYHLAQDSLCIDRCNPNFNPNPGETDIDGEPRKVDGDSNGTSIVDIGADEYYWSPADFDKDEIVNFIDYAKFANYWKSNNPGFSLDGDNDVDYYDLDLFCEDWLWTPAWDQPMDSMMMGEGRVTAGSAQTSIGEGLSQSMQGLELLADDYSFILTDQQDPVLIFIVNGEPQPPEITLEPSDTVTIGLELEAGPNIWGWSATYKLSNAQGELIPEGITFPTVFDFPSYWMQVSPQEVYMSGSQFFSNPVTGPTTIMDGLVFRCLGPTDVILTITIDPEGTFIDDLPYGTVQTLIIHQSEP